MSIEPLIESFESHVPELLSSKASSLVCKSLDADSFNAVPLSAAAVENYKNLIMNEFGSTNMQVQEESNIGKAVLTIIRITDDVLREALHKAVLELEDVILFGTIPCKDWITQTKLAFHY